MLTDWQYNIRGVCGVEKESQPRVVICLPQPHVCRRHWSLSQLLQCRSKYNIVYPLQPPNFAVTVMSEIKHGCNLKIIVIICLNSSDQICFISALLVCDSYKQSPCCSWLTLFFWLQLAEKVKSCVACNSLTIEPIPGDSSYPRYAQATALFTCVV